MGFFDSVGGKPFKVFAPNKRPFYLISFGGLHRRDLPNTVEVYQKKIALLDSYKYRAAAAWITKDTARNEDQAEEWLSNLPDNWQIYLSESDRDAVQKINLEIFDAENHHPSSIVSLMMRNRLAYHVEVAQDSIKGADKISIVEPWFNGDRLLAPGDKLQTLNGSVVRVVEPYRDEGCLSVSGLSIPLWKGEPLFLMDGDSFVMGHRTWTDEHSDELLITRSGNGSSQAAQIRLFYEKEQQKEEEEDKKDPLVSEGNPSEPMPLDPVQTGKESTGDSFILDAPTPDSIPHEPLMLLQSS